ncbi:hypothetical protein SLOPH_1817 [Spraguea lophii 42_110]|uniref:Transcription initiation factor IIF subunit alpha n=1 Tax=Spraguea lophii (strain 42_110) TaxID=1358809 RepID=S7W9Y9_SPRLO|nr:hypothetical protein SLOPH_1817 [Spraguea lophii 42_110]
MCHILLYFTFIIVLPIMKKYKLIYNTTNKNNRSIFTLPYDINTLSTPCTITRKSEVNDEQEISKNPFFNKKSVQIEEVDEEYQKILDKEKYPLIIEDNEKKQYQGRLQDRNNDNYFVFVNTGKSFKVIHIDNWYRFAIKHNNANANTEDAEKVIDQKIKEKGTRNSVSEEEEREEIDYKAEFSEDDTAETAMTVENQKKKLSSAGREIKKLMKKYENPEDKKSHKRKVITTESLKHILDKRQLTLKKLISKIKSKYKFSAATKHFVQNFITEHCNVVLNGEEKLIQLKKENKSE